MRTIRRNQERHEDAPPCCGECESECSNADSYACDGNGIPFIISMACLRMCVFSDEPVLLENDVVHHPLQQ